MVTIPNPSNFGFDLKRYFHEGTTGQAPGSFWTLWGGYITADHVYKEQNHTPPPFASGNISSGNPVIDACLMGCDNIPSRHPRAPIEGERLFIYGFPGGSNTVSPRIGTAYLKRSSSVTDYDTPTWIAKIDEWPNGVTGDMPEGVFYEAVTVGMSGGLIMAEDGTPLGVLVGDSGPWHEDADLDLDQVLDFVALSDIWTVFANEKNPVLLAGTKVRVERFDSDDFVSLSRIYINDRFICHGLEDAFQEIKIPGETRIPQGQYALGVKAEGGFHARYSRIFGSEHLGMLHIKDVPEFEHILIHVGNYHHDTDGCLLVGNADVNNRAVWTSKVTYKRLYAELISAALAGDAMIEFIDMDRP